MKKSFVLIQVGKSGLSENHVLEITKNLKVGNVVKVKFLKSAIENVDKKQFAKNILDKINKKIKIESKLVGNVLQIKKL